MFSFLMVLLMLLLATVNFNFCFNPDMSNIWKSLGKLGTQLASTQGGFRVVTSFEQLSKTILSAELGPDSLFCFACSINI